MNKLIIISGPSGAGEDSVIGGLQERMALVRVTTTSTREMRPGEYFGNPYYFITKEEFEQGIKDDAFFEYTEQDRGNFYGVTKKEIERVKAAEGVGIWKIDYKGVLYAKEHLPKEDTVAILISAPMEIIEQRLKGRANGDDDGFIAERLAYAKGWYENKEAFDYEVENAQGKLEDTIDQVEAIIRKELSLNSV